MAKPTHRLTMKSKDHVNSRNIEIGAIWKQPDGNGMSLVLGKGVTISWRDSVDHWFNIWPIEGRVEREVDNTGDYVDRGDVEIPF